MGTSTAWRQEMRRFLSNGLSLEWHRCPIRLELVREVLPLLIGVFLVAIALGYAWARAAYTSFVR